MSRSTLGTRPKDNFTSVGQALGEDHVDLLIGQALGEDPVDLLIGQAWVFHAYCLQLVDSSGLQSWLH